MSKKSGNFSTVLNKLKDAKEWILDHGKIVMPVFLVFCVLITVLIAFLANRSDRLKKEAEEAAAAAQENVQEVEEDIIPVYELEKDAYPEVNAVVKKYYDAQVSGDIDTISSMNTYLNDIEKLKIEELSRYIEAYPEIAVYTKPGITDSSYVAYVTSQVKFTDIETTLPGMQTYYIEKNTDGSLTISDGTYDEQKYEYIKNLTLQDDVVALNNEVVVEYNDKLTADVEVSEYVAYVKEKINEEVGEILAEAEAPAAEVVEPSENDNQAGTATIVTMLQTNSSVKLRKSDSTDSDVLTLVANGAKVKMIEEKINGWTKVEYDGKTGFIKSDYLEPVDAVMVEVGNDTENNTDTSTTSTPATSTTAEGNTAKKVNASSVRMRKEPNTDCEVIVTLYTGTKVVFLGTEDDWSKVKYDGKTGYIKSEFLDD